MLLKGGGGNGEKLGEKEEGKYGKREKREWEERGILKLAGAREVEKNNNMA